MPYSRISYQLPVWRFNPGPFRFNNYNSYVPRFNYRPQVSHYISPIYWRGYVPDWRSYMPGFMPGIFHRRNIIPVMIRPDWYTRRNFFMPCGCWYRWPPHQIETKKSEGSENKTPPSGTKTQAPGKTETTAPTGATKPPANPDSKTVPAANADAPIPKP
jgi:hypothetical protein